MTAELTCTCGLKEKIEQRIKELESEIDPSKKPQGIVVIAESKIEIIKELKGLLAEK